jgi:hypothetical protein
MTVSMGLAMIAAGLTAASVAELKRTRSEFAKTRTEYGLQEAQDLAAVSMLNNGQSGRLSWSVTTDSGEARVLAEPEYRKASFATAAAVDDELLQQLGVQDPLELKARLAQMPSVTGGQAWIAGLDSARLWRACAPSLISRYGQADKLGLSKSSPPNSQAFTWRPGEVWRVRTTLNGWTDDRIVRFTGNDQHPAVTVERRFMKSQAEDDQCEAVLSQGA